MTSNRQNLPQQCYLIKQILMQKLNKNHNHFAIKSEEIKETRVIFYLKENQLESDESNVVNFYVSKLKSKRSQHSLKALCLKYYKESLVLEKTWEKLNNHINFENDYSKRDLEFLTIHESGILYVYGRDEYMRPNLYFSLKAYIEFENFYKEKNVRLQTNPSNKNKKSIKIDSYDLYERFKTELISYILYILNFIDNNLLLPGQVESINFIIDIDHINHISTIPKGINDILSIFAQNYTYNVDKAFIINSDLMRDATIIGYLKYIETLKKK